ncbi:Cell cycle regulator of non-homologous end joining, partial [Galemys pyrenaicus]
KREMEELKSSTKKRVLPSWMTAQETQKSTGQAINPKRRRTVAAAAKGDIRYRWHLPGSQQVGVVWGISTVYCMNEAELVDVALGILTEGQKQEKLLEQPFLAGADRPELSHTSSQSPSASSSPSSPGRSEDEDNGEDALPPGLSPSQGSGGSVSASSRSPGEDEDVLKYVREIFFS